MQTCSPPHQVCWSGPPRPAPQQPPLTISTSKRDALLKRTRSANLWLLGPWDWHHCWCPHDACGWLILPLMQRSWGSGPARAGEREEVLDRLSKTSQALPSFCCLHIWPHWSWRSRAPQKALAVLHYRKNENDLTWLCAALWMLEWALQ
jgi:hypothetical protein